MPPGPVRVSRRTRGSFNAEATFAILSARPRRDVGGIGSAPVGPCGLLVVRPTATASKRNVAFSSSPKAAASRRAVCGYTVPRSPRSTSLMVLALIPERSASSSCVNPAVERKCFRVGPSRWACSVTIATRKPVT